MAYFLTKNLYNRTGFALIVWVQMAASIAKGRSRVTLIKTAEHGVRTVDIQLHLKERVLTPPSETNQIVALCHLDHIYMWA